MDIWILKLGRTMITIERISGERVELEETNSEKDFGAIINKKLKWDPTRKKDIKKLEQVQR